MGGSLYPPPTFLPAFLPGAVCVCICFSYKMGIFFMCWRMAFVSFWSVGSGPFGSSLLWPCHISFLSLSLFRTNFAVIQQMYLQAAPPCLLAHNLKTLYAFWQIACAFFSTKENFLPLTFASEALHSS